MKKIAIFFAVLSATMMAMAQNYKYSLTETRITSAELNAKSEPVYIAIKNLSATNSYYYVGNTGAVPYSRADFSAEAVFVWEPVADENGMFYLKKLDGSYMQTSSPKDFGSIDNAARFTTTNPTSAGSGAAYFNGDGDSQSYINGNDDAHLVRFVKGADWINVQNGNSGTPKYNTGSGGWTIHYVYEVTRTESTEPDPEPDPEPQPGLDADKVYYIQWKNTGGNHITEGSDHYLTVAGKSVNKAQFWRFVPTENTNCYYIQNVVTGRYMGSCNMTPSSASRVTTSDTPVEYYVGATAATGGEIAGCHYLSSTDCDGYSNESAGPRALNKDGASSYIITWQAGTSRVGSYWKLVETTDTYERPQHTSVAKQLGLYFNPCGVTSANYLTQAVVHGEGALDRIVYQTEAKPARWHVPYSYDHGVVMRGTEFTIDITLSSTPDADLTANAYFDWEADGEFETTAPIALSGTAGTVKVTVPEEAAAGPMRMRIRINSNGLDLAEDDVEGFVYDFPFAVAEPQAERMVTIAVNGANRGEATLSAAAGSYPLGTTLTAKATPKGNATFLYWKEEGVVVSHETEYTFTVEHNVNLKAYFTDNTKEEDASVRQSMTDNADENLVYDLQGRRVENPDKGIYIKNRKKVVLR